MGFHRPHRYLASGGYVYERVERNHYRRVDPEEVGGVPFLIPTSDVMVHLGKGRWIRTHQSVLAVDCPSCGSPKGECCQGVAGLISGTHYERRDGWRLRYFTELSRKTG